MNEQERHQLFTELVARHQSELYGYLFAVVRNWGDADDLYQSVCLALWRKFDSFRPGSSFFSWARQMARIELSNFLRGKRSSMYVREELLDDIAEAIAEPQGDGTQPYLQALCHCRRKLDAADEELLQLHYADDLSSRAIADRLQRSQSSVCNSLNRIRDWLLECIRRELAQQEHSGRKHL
jgi:RNA polymerase sigma-70 factor, ECF subfamily